MSIVEQPLLLFLALFALYGPLAAVSSYFPVVARRRPADQVRLAVGLFLYVTVFSLAALWVGEPLLELLGISTAALTATGGIALLYAGIPLHLRRPRPRDGLRRHRRRHPHLLPAPR